MSYSQEIGLDINLIQSQKVNLSAVERRCESIIKRRSVKKQSQVEWLLKTIEFINYILFIVIYSNYHLKMYYMSNNLYGNNNGKRSNYIMC